jgi:hypothetical protein
MENAKFEGWCVLELMGHAREAGFVTTQYYGDKALFQVDVPEIPAQEETLTVPKWSDDDKLLPVGTVIQKEPIPGRTCMLNPAAIYRMNPATEEAVRAAISAGVRRTIKVVSMPVLPADRQLNVPYPESEAIENEEDES